MANEKFAWTRERLEYLLRMVADTFVRKQPGKELSTNDFTNALKNKLDNIESGADVNAIESVSVDGTPVEPDQNKNVNISLDEYAKKADYVNKEDYASEEQYGIVKVDPTKGVRAVDGVLSIQKPTDTAVKGGVDDDNPLVPSVQHAAAFYGLAKAAGDTTQVSSGNYVGSYTPAAKTAIQKMLDVPAKADIPTRVSKLLNDAGYLTTHQDISGKADKADLASVATSGDYDDLINKPTNVSAFANDAGYLTSFTESDPTVPAWAKAANKPSYTAAEVGATTANEVAGMISNAIGGVHSFEVEIAQALPVSNIKEHTIYFVPKTGAENDVYDEYIYFNGGWEMIGNTQIDLSAYAKKAELPVVPNNVSAFTNDAGYLTTHQDISGKADKAALAAVATSGSYNDLVNKPSIPTKATDLTDDSGHYTKPAGGIPASDLASGVIPDVPVQDVQVNGTSILNAQGIANVPIASENVIGAIKVANATHGLGMWESGMLHIETPNDGEIKAGVNSYKPVSAYNQHKSTFYGLAKAAGDTTQASSNNAVGVYTNEAKAAIRAMLGVASIDDIPDVPIQDIMVNGVSIVANGTANIPVASQNNFGVVKYSDVYGLMTNANGVMYVNSSVITGIKAGTDAYRPIVPGHQHESVFYGLSKAAGVDMASSANAVGTYTDAAKAAIKNMIGVNDGSEVVRLI